MKKFTKILSLALASILLCMTLVSCGGPNKDPDKAVAALKEEGYTAVKGGSLSAGFLSVLGIKDVETVVTATKEGEFLTVLYFKDKDAAKTAEENVKKQSENDKKEQKEEDSDWTFGRSGALIYFGTKDAVKDAK